MKTLISKIFKGSGSSSLKETARQQNKASDIIKSIEEQAFAISEYNVMYGATRELGGYFYFKTFIIGAFKVKTKNGAQLKINGVDFSLNLKTDMDEFESEHTSFPARYMTSIDFQLEETDIAKMESTGIKSLELLTKNQSIVFKV